MRRSWKSFVALFTCLLLSTSVTLGQQGGSRAGLRDDEDVSIKKPNGPSMLDRNVVEGFIAIDGRAEVRTAPTEIRIVLAITSQGQTANECQTAVHETIEKLKRSWSKAGLPAEKAVEDFIAVLPVYEWSLEERGVREVGVEKRTGFRMQSNIHLAVPDDETASKALTVAFEEGVTDIIAFDYWSKELDEVKTKAREQAVEAALRKSDTLLTALLGERPPVINVQEETSVIFPESLYHSFVNRYYEETNAGWLNNRMLIYAPRPRNTYYRGLFLDGDVQSRELPMRPEISVVSTVRLYFESPAASKSKKDGEKEKSSR